MVLLPSSGSNSSRELPRGDASGIGWLWSISSDASPARCPPQALASSRMSLLSTSSFFCASPWTLMFEPPSPPSASPSTPRSEEHTSELQSLMRSSYAVFSWKKKQDDESYQHTTLIH